MAERADMIFGNDKARHGSGHLPMDIIYDCTPIHGYEATREAAMAAFAKSWRRE